MPKDLIGLKLFLSKMDTSHVSEAYMGWLNDPRVNRFLESRFQRHTHASTVDYVKSIESNNELFMFAIFTRQAHRHIGNIKLGPVHPIHLRGDIGIMIGDAGSFHQGFGTEAIGLLTRFAFEDLDLRRLTAGCYENNLGAIKAFEKNGFMREGLLRHHATYNGTRVNVIQLGLLQTEWKSDASLG